MSALTPSRLQRAEHYYASHAVVLPAGVSLDDAMKPAFWAHVSEKLRQHDTIRLIPEEGGYFAEALVVSRGRGFAKLLLLNHVPFAEEEQDVSDEVEVRWRGPHCKWSIVRKKDGVVLREGLADKADALREAA